jgi:hypothetical protein
MPRRLTADAVFLSQFTLQLVRARFGSSSDSYTSSKNWSAMLGSDCMTFGYDVPGNVIEMHQRAISKSDRLPESF